jgi:hypothetical protein
LKAKSNHCLVCASNDVNLKNEALSRPQLGPPSLLALIVAAVDLT